ncbi:MAG: hypothetical protein LBQ30_00925 [Treponema sp.]|jgi:hypothetical protein|nr:hypothetical protein [Treponema sp.]
MKKALVGFLILALSAGVFAQEEKEQGLKFSGTLKTGIQFGTSNGKNEVEVKDENGNVIQTNEYKHEPSIRLYNDDAGEETRFDLDGSYTQDNYGVVFRLRTNTVVSGPEIEVNQAYVWADLANQLVNLKVGKIDDSVWNTGGDEDFHYSTGTGLRLEVKPIEGLNVGLFLNSPDSPADNPGKFDWISKVLWQGDEGPLGVLAEHFLLETSLGFKYEHDLFNVAAGLRLDSEADGLTTEEFYGETTSSEVADAGQGLGIYAGFEVKAVENLTAIVEARFNNMGGYDKYGWIWINETLGYAITEQLEAGLVMHQFLFGGENKFVTLKDAASVPAYLTFEPSISYGLNDQWTVGLAIPFGIWPDIVDYDIGVKPKVSYKLGENASINAFYLFNLEQPGKGGYDTEADDPTLRNTVQIDFIWTF